jgi:hypothetical protein
MFGIIFRIFRERADRFLSHFARDEFFFFSNHPIFFKILFGIIGGGKMKRRNQNF